ncbi:MAG: hypothetical protein OEM82_04190 [Acidobacteriota bacterium]|nr:hypothetical protein [Acidobacteriota bacterium]MDH3530973.1 hypothetical protein [Acidobacteriota bacterium]
MKFQKTFAALLSMFVLSVAAVAQMPTGANDGKKIENSTLVFTEKEAEKMPIAVGNNLYCAGYIQKGPISANVEIVGADDEKDQHIYAEGDALYLNAGSNNGVKVGDMYSVIRPRGSVNSDWTSKSSLGVYVQEVGAVEVVNVKPEVSVARVKVNCSVVMFGDLVTPMVERESPMFVKREPLDLFADPSGKASGRIVMARDGAELIGREMIVYLDLGREDNVKVGDYLTVYRPLGTGNIYQKVIKESSIDNREDGYESDRYEGGHFSNQASRKKGATAGGSTVTTEGAKSRRPAGLRKVLGEVVVLNVMESTATAVVVRTASEIHTGDYVEVQ